MKPLPRPLTILAMAGLLAACATPSPSPSGTSSDSTVSPSPSGESSVSSAPSASPAEPDIAGEPPALAVEPIAPRFLDPIGILGAPDGSLLVNERAGRILAIDPDGGEPSTFLDIRDRVLGGGEQGLLGLALDPQWPDVGRAFVHYTGRDGNPVLAEFRAADGAAAALDPSTERQLLSLEDPYGNHNGGQLAFGPDGYLWMSLGDGGAGGDPFDNGRNPSVLLGKILRIDVDGGDPYRIPADNPFADGADGAPEVFLYGLRNPWRFSFDSETGLLWIGDVGQGAFEEIDRIDPATQAGANLGWDIMEATHCYDAAECDSAGMVAPVAEYGRDFGCSVTGGYVYRGDDIPDLWGWYLYSDYCSGNLFALRADISETETTPRVLLQTDANASSFGVDADGELYLADIGSGTIYRIVADGG